MKNHNTPSMLFSRIVLLRYFSTLIVCGLAVAILMPTLVIAKHTLWETDPELENRGRLLQDAEAVDDDENGFVSLFDGESLEGWSGADGLWSVDKGCIVGETTAENPLRQNSFLIWKNGELADFELRLKYRIESGNSGIQYRSRDLGEHRVGGYQADIDVANSYTGILYEEQGRGILCGRAKQVEISPDGTRTESETPTCDERKFLDSMAENADAWNEYVIIAKGNRLTHRINGFVTADIIDRQTDKSAATGILALQLHTGPAMKIHFKDIRLKRIEE